MKILTKILMRTITKNVRRSFCEDFIESLFYLFTFRYKQNLTKMRLKRIQFKLSFFDEEKIGGIYEKAGIFILFCLFIDIFDKRISSILVYGFRCRFPIYAERFNHYSWRYSKMGLAKRFAYHYIRQYIRAGFVGCKHKPAKPDFQFCV